MLEFGSEMYKDLLCPVLVEGLVHNIPMHAFSFVVGDFILDVVLHGRNERFIGPLSCRTSIGN